MATKNVNLKNIAEIKAMGVDADSAAKSLLILLDGDVETAKFHVHDMITQMGPAEGDEDEVFHYLADMLASLID